MQSWIRDLIDLKTQISVLQNCMQQPASSHAAPASHYRVADNVKYSQWPSGCLRSTCALAPGQQARQQPDRWEQRPPKVHISVQMYLARYLARYLWIQ
jgi:hypothetical protein